MFNLRMSQVCAFGGGGCLDLSSRIKKKKKMCRRSPGWRQVPDEINTTGARLVDWHLARFQHKNDRTHTHAQGDSHTHTHTRALSPSTSRHDPRENTSNSVKPSGSGYDETILKPMRAKSAAANTLRAPPIPVNDAPSTTSDRSPLFKGTFHVKSIHFIM